MIKFKTDKLFAQFFSEKLDKRLRTIIYSILGELNESSILFYCNVTDVFRAQEEQDNIYKDDPEYQKQKWESVHQYWRGIDFIIENEEGENYDKNFHENLVKKINNAFQYNDKQNHQTALYHEIGSNGVHIHIQVHALNETRLLK